MTGVPVRNDVAEAMAHAWHADSARMGFEHWQELCEREGWSDCPRNAADLIRVFGASWYLTRFVFFKGREAAELFDAGTEPDFSMTAIRERLPSAEAGGELDEKLEALRGVKNVIMLEALLAWLRGDLPLQELERALSHLAEAVIEAMIRLVGLDDPGDDIQFAVLGMGRLAGREMIFGSDLDLIFLYRAEEDADMSRMHRLVRLLLRNIAAATPNGALYDVDMRLRPHGTAGPLITSDRTFIEHHLQDREIWERQMMTRCRPVFDPDGVAKDCLVRIRDAVYAPHDPGRLRVAVYDMRMRVERELGSPRGKLEIKRGPGGLMDVDFASHYVQLLHGHAAPALRECSTRLALGAAAACGMAAPETIGPLLSGYDYLKRLECCLRLFDMKSISAFQREGKDAVALARAMQPGGEVDTFLEEFHGTTARIRAAFNAALGTGS